MSKRERARRQEARERGDLRKQLLTYSLAAGAALVGAQAAQAAIVYSGPKDIWVENGNTPEAIDLDNAGPVEFSIRYRYHRYTTTQTNFNTTATYPYFSGTTSTRTYWNRHYGQELKHFTGSAAVSVSGVMNFPAGATIDAGDNWAATSMWLGTLRQSGSNFSNSFRQGNFHGNPGYIGVCFDDLADGGAPKYGWIAFEATLDLKRGHITGWAYEDSGAPIIAGDAGPIVPEPSGLALLAAGAAGLTAFRKKRKE